MNKKIISLFIFSILTITLAFTTINVKADESTEDYSTIQGERVEPIFESDLNSLEVDTPVGSLREYNLIKGNPVVKEDESGNKYFQSDVDGEVKFQYGDESWANYYVESEILIGNIGGASGGGISVRFSQIDGKESLYTFRIRLVNDVIQVYFRKCIAGAWKSDVLIGDAPEEVQSSYKTEKIKLGVAIVGDYANVYINNQQIGDTVNTKSISSSLYLDSGALGIRWWAMMRPTEDSKWYGSKAYSLEELTSIEEFDLIDTITPINDTVTMEQGEEIDPLTLVDITGLHGTSVDLFRNGLMYEINDNRVVNYDDGKFITQNLGTTSVKIFDPITMNDTTINIEVIKGEGPQINNVQAQIAEVNSDQEALINSLTQNITTEDGAELTVDTSLVDTSNIGRYRITYTATKDNKTTIIKSFVDIVDTTAPEIVLSKDTIEEPIIEGKVYTEEDLRELIVSATDNYDQDINVMIYGFEKIDIYKIGDYVVDYYAVDESGNETTVQLTFTVYDDEAPEIIGVKDITHKVGVEYRKWMFDVYSLDNAEGKEVPIDIDYGNYQYDKLGVYTIIYSATDSSGNKTEVEVEVTVTTDEVPTLDFVENTEINDEGVVIVKKGEIEDIKSLLTATDVTGLDISDNIEVEGDYDLQKTGTYNLSAKVVDAVGNESMIEFTLKVESNINIVLVSIIGVAVIAACGAGIVLIRKRG